MKKILLAFDGANYSAGAFEFARRLNEQERILLTGIFLPQTDLADIMSFADGVTGQPFISDWTAEDYAALKKNTEHFAHQCESNSIEYRIHDQVLCYTMDELKKETRFCDLMIVGSQSFFNTAEADTISGKLEEILHSAECPVIVMPEQYTFPENTILAYDGSASSVYAIKQFAYLFPQIASLQTLLLSIHPGDDDPIPDRHYIEDLAARHYSDLTLYNVDLDPARYLSSWATYHTKGILVCGAFGRSFFSRFFKKSFIADLMNEHSMPIFVAHR